MKADWGLLGGAAAAMLAIPLLVLAWSGTPPGRSPGGAERRRFFSRSRQAAGLCHR